MLRCVAFLVLGLALCACESKSPAPPPLWVDPETIPPAFNCMGRQGERICDGTWSALCEGERTVRDAVNCKLLDETCVPDLGCRVCAPNNVGCSADNELFLCDADGDSYEVMETCALGTVCNAAARACIDLCAEAELSRSYVGCDYWATVTSNSLLDTGFEFEISVANPHGVEAQVTIDGGALMSAITRVVPAGEVRRIALPWVDALVNRDGAQTRRAAGGGYHIVSSVPVTVAQFNPMEFLANDVPSFTNDASLLLPSHILSGNYLIVSRPTLAFNAVSEGVIIGSPGFVAITAVEDVDVEITSSAFTIASPDGSVPAMAPGDRVTLSIARGDVVQLVTALPTECQDSGAVTLTGNGGVLMICAPEPTLDLTGTSLRATGPINVVAGHDCAYVPFDTQACDHLEEVMFPEESLGKRIPIGVSASIVGTRELPDVVRIVSAHDDNTLTFTPAVHDTVTLQRGESIELVTDRDFVVEGSEALMAAQFLVGQSYGDEAAQTGDPAMCLGIPSEQWRNNYAFTIAGTYEHDFVNVIAPTGAPILLDGNPVGEFTAIEGTTFSVARRSLSSGQHRMTSSVPFGITVYGYALYTSYAYPGGLDFRIINGPD